MRKDTLATRKRIIDTAEALFAERGVESTSLLEIAKVSGQKNRSALQYHFTNKEGLLDAVLDKHAQDISDARTLMLDSLEQRGDYTLYELIEALVLPMASQLDNKDGGRAFLKIHSQLMTTQAYSELRQRRDRGSADTQRLFAMTAPFLNTEDKDAIRSRFLLSGSLLVHGLAAYLVQTDNIARTAFLHTLVQGLVDLLQQSSHDGP
ncbi:MAG: helix-turn-helix domain-containing protein [Halioglobus sp.]